MQVAGFPPFELGTAIGKIGDPRAVEPLLDILAHPGSFGSMLEAETALEWFPDERAAKSFVGLLDGVLRSHAARVLGAISEAPETPYELRHLIWSKSHVLLDDGSQEVEEPNPDYGGRVDDSMDPNDSRVWASPTRTVTYQGEPTYVSAYLKRPVLTRLDRPSSPGHVLCPQCRRAMPFSKMFCTGCGSKLSKMLCPRCTAYVPAFEKICANCGAELDGALCPGCETVMPVNQEVCTFCGTKLRW